MDFVLKILHDFHLLPSNLLQSQSERFKSRRTGTTGLVYVDLIRFLEATVH